MRIFLPVSEECSSEVKELYCKKLERGGTCEEYSPGQTTKVLCHRNKLDRFATHREWNGIKYESQNLGFLLLLQKKHLVV
jgi:hypothetical protein